MFAFQYNTLVLTTLTNKSCLDLFFSKCGSVGDPSHFLPIRYTFQYQARLSFIESLQTESFSSFRYLVHFTLYHDMYCTYIPVLLIERPYKNYAISAALLCHQKTIRIYKQLSAMRSHVIWLYLFLSTKT